MAILKKAVKPGDLYRDPKQVVSQWIPAGTVAPRLLASRVRGDWWDLLQQLGITLIVTREYENFVLSLSGDSRSRVTYIPLPHPSGVAYDAQRRELHVASTRNPNQVFTFRTGAAALKRGDGARVGDIDRVLMPVRSRMYPGALYLHDLVWHDGALHGCAVGMNAIIRMDEDGRFTPVWWPRCLESKKGLPDLALNHLQLNAFAAGASLETSFFSASAASPGRYRPGDPRFPVDKRGVIFSGGTRDVLATGLTRPHAARIHRKKLWVANSGYGELGFVKGTTYQPVMSLGSWTRGLAFAKGYAFVGLSRVLPRFHAYAPGLDPKKACCGVAAVELASQRVVATITWPAGNQIFAVETLPASHAVAWPFLPGQRDSARDTALFYSYNFPPR